MMHINAKTTPINDANYSCHIANSCRTCLTNHMGCISCCITPLDINSLEGGHTQTHTCMHTLTHTSNTHTYTYTHILTIHKGSILRNQVHAGQKRPGLKFNKSCCHAVVSVSVANSCSIYPLAQTLVVETILLYNFKSFLKSDYW